MPDAKSLLPCRAFRSEHAQLRPEPHSIASHGPDTMDPLQTTRMRNGVLYAAEWPCCHDPLRLSLGSEDPFYTRRTRALDGGVRARTPAPSTRAGLAHARTPPKRAAPPPRAGRCTHAHRVRRPLTSRLRLPSRAHRALRPSSSPLPPLRSACPTCAHPRRAAMMVNAACTRRLSI